jgi:hypothetical protein
MNKGFTYILLSSIGLIIGMFLPITLTIVAVGFIVLLHLILTQSFIDVFFVSVWLIWYLLQQFVPVLLPDPYGITPYFTLPLLIGSCWVSFGVEKKRHKKIRPALIVVFTCSYLFLSLATSNRPLSVLELLAVTVNYIVTALCFTYLGCEDSLYFLISTTWLLLIPFSSFFFGFIRAAYLILLLRATYRKYDWESSLLLPTTTKTKRSRVRFTTNKTRSTSAMAATAVPANTSQSLAHLWTRLHNSAPVTTDESPPSPPPMASEPILDTMKKAQEKEEKMKTLLSQAFTPPQTKTIK